MAVPHALAAADASPSPARSTSQMATTTISVEGMTCGACTSAVENAFKGVDGAGEVSVSLMMGRAVVHHDPTVLSPEKVAEMIDNCGFDAAVLSTDSSSIPTQSASSSKAPGTDVATTILAVEGMTCGACTSAVEGGLAENPGVRSVSVSLLSERAVVEHDLSTISAEQLAEIVEDRGFGAKVLETSTPQADSRGSQESTGPQSTVTTVAIEGMTCGACTSSVQAAFDGVEGLVQFNISLLAERAIITHNPSVLTSQKIVGLIEDAGFDAKIVSEVQAFAQKSGVSRVTLDLHGLRDANSAVTLEDSLLQKPGIIAASITLATSRLMVSHDPAVIGIRAVVAAIEAAGYNALLADSDDNNAQLESLAKTKEVLEWKRAFLISLSFAIPVFLVNMILPMYLPMLDFGACRILPGLYLGELTCLILTIPVQFGIGKRFYITSFKSLRHRAPTMDVLVMLGTSTAFFYSVFTMIVAVLMEPHKRPSTVFDTSTMLITFITLGRWLENRAKGQTSAALSRLMSLAPSMTTIYDDPIAAEKSAEEWTNLDTEEPKPASSNERPVVAQRVIPTELIEVGDIIILHPGDKVSADGIVIRGETYIDESMITGEALPIHKTRGSMVIAGTVNGTSAVDFKVIRTGKDTQLSKIVKLVQDAQTSRASIQRMADVVAGYFVPSIISLGLATFFGWMFVSHLLPNPPKIFAAEEGGGKVMVCLKLCISVIVFACPCALGLSTPTAVMVGTGVGATQGILVKGGAVLEAATKVTHVVFDKTGTLTTGKMSVAEAKIEPQWTSNDLRRRLWWLIVGLAEMDSEHPIGKTIYLAAKDESGNSSESGLPGSLGDFVARVGKGISALVEPASSAERTRYRVLIGNATFLTSNNVPVPETAEQTADAADPKDFQVGITQIHVAIDGQFAGTILLRDTVKVTAVVAVAALHRMGLSTSLITGDSHAAAISIASAVGIPASAVHASVTPLEKQSIISSLQETGERVAMVGDGINDSPALATASIGIALASGTDVAMEAADIVLMRPDDLLSVPASLSLSRSVFNRIKLNLVWACAYNVIGLPFAMGLFLPFGGFMLPPMAAGAAMALSSISVVVSSLLLKFWKRPKWMDAELLEKEVGTPSDSCSNSQKNWLEATLFSGAAPSSTRRVVAWIRAAPGRAWSLVTGRPAQGDGVEPSYVPLQTVEPVV
ncbi:Cu(2+)-transporting P-type ATPase CCC2 [Aspergillus undulatus]|uniref:Cu(2+)-transporting P-type ATPase CCC2 n=1 Tax=Aspergillus undulatus TaxID=1810928 RepID=UPI003CCCD222